VSEWREIKLGDLIARGVAEIRTGPFGTQLRASDYGSEGVPVINVRNLGYGTVRTAEIERVGFDVQERLRGHLLAQGDVVFGRKGAVDRHILVTQKEAGWMQGSDCIRMRLLEGSPISPAFLSKTLLTPSHKAWMEAQASHGATMASLNQAIIGRISVSVPELPRQRRIAAVLAAFDELIEINERRIELLEDLARSLYREWFVRFRFPGHEAVEFVDSQLGRVPSGWPVKPTREVLNPIGGGTPSKKRSDFWEGGQIDWFTPSDLTKAETRYLAESQSRITALGLANSSARLFPAGSVLMTSRATLGVLGIAATEASCNQGFIVIPPVAGMPAEFIFEWLATQDGALESIATGATFKEITKTAFARFPFLLPPREVLARFEEAIVPIGRQLGLFEETIRALATTRDLLLPRLVTGRVDIDDIDLAELLRPEAA
jgi:type I restriction enzyme S subunit